MSYYKPSFSQTLAMARGRGYSSPRGSSYRGSSNRGNSSWGGSANRGGYPMPGGGSGGGGRFPSFVGSMDSRNFDSRSKYSSSDRFARPHSEDYHKAYRPDSSYSRDGGRRSPDRKRLRTEAPSSRHDSSYGGYGPSRYPSQSSYSDRRSYSGERHSTSTPFRREEFRRPSGPPPSRGGYRGRLSARGSRAPLRLRDRPARRRLLDSSYAVRKRVLPRSSDYARRLKISRMRSAIARRATKRRTSEKEGSGDEKTKEKKPKDPESKEEEEKDESVKDVKQENSPEKDVKSESGDEKAKKKSFIKLNCPHCGVKAVTFRKYDIHLSSRTHMIAMRKIALKQKSILAQMRQAQRNTQNELEKNSEELTGKTNFCPLCKLNYKQKKSVHQLSEAHKNMKKFLMPYCKVCNITFKSPMIYESHCCSIEHIKRKQRVENSSDASAEEDNLENFTTIDSVGEGDGSETEEKKEDPKEPVNVGIEQIRRVEAHYCDLCKMYLPRMDEHDMPKVLSRHCKLRVHMQRYVRYKEDKDLEKRAEKLQRRENSEKEVKDKKDVNDKEGSQEPEGKEKDGEKTDGPTKGTDDEEARDDKLWADVDKDLGDILAEAESGNKSSDEDEEDSHVNGERYDRFKLSEKSDEEKIKKADGENGPDANKEVSVESK